MKITYSEFILILDKVRELNRENRDYMVLLELYVNQTVSFISGIIRPDYDVKFTVDNLFVVLDVLKSWSVKTVVFDKNCIRFELPFDSSI